MRDDGTLIVAIPSNGGLVIASDSRLSVESSFCDGVEKFIELQRPERLLLFVTGRRGFWPASITIAPDPCTFIKTNSREFDFGETAKAYIENFSGRPSELDLKSLSDHCIKALTTYIGEHPYRLNGMSVTSSLTLASFDIETSTYQINTIEFSTEMTSGGNISSKLILDAKGSGDDELAEPYVFGELDYYQTHVHNRLKDEPIRQSTRQFLSKAQKVGETSPQDAADRAADMIEAASRRTLVVPASSGIGGPVAVRLVGATARPSKLTISPPP